MSGLFSSPKAPDPYATAAAQSQANSQAAQTQAQYNMVDQVTPYGNLNYTQSGTYPDGTPKYTATQTLNPTQTQTLANQDQLSQNVTGLGLNYVDQLSGLSTNPFDANSLGVSAPKGDQSYIDSATNALYDQYKSRLDPQYQEQDAALAQKLANQGISQGTEAYTNAMRDQSLAKNDAYQSALNQSVANGQTAASNQYNMQSDAYQKALGNALTLRDQPINELSALLGTSSGVQNPTLTSTPQESISPTDISGLIQNNYGTKSANHNALVSALGQLGGAATSAAVMHSDIRLKSHIKYQRRTPKGYKVYSFVYNKSPTVTHYGVMAQEVLKVNPSAVVVMPDGYLGVDYSKIDM